MAFDYPQEIAEELKIRPEQAGAAIGLLEDGNTVPFICRYRKEATGGLNDAQVEAIQQKFSYLRELDERKKSIRKTIKSQGKLTDELAEQIDKTRSKVELEDLYLPFKPRKKTKASEALARGLGPLADLIWEQGQSDQSPDEIAARFVDPEKEIPDAQAAWAGAMDIVAERVSLVPEVRGALRKLFAEEGIIQSRVVPEKREDQSKYRDYFEFEERISQIPSHRFLAIQRGRKEKVLGLGLHVDQDKALARIRSLVVRGDGGALADRLESAIRSAYERLLFPALEREILSSARERAEAEAIEVFSKNLKRVLMAPPLGGKRVLAIDPGFANGCKLAVLDKKGDLLENATIHPHKPREKVEESERILSELCAKHRVEAVAMGNGTASRETDELVRKLWIDGKLGDVIIAMVNESGASVYSASPIGREEFPKKSEAVRGAVSIGRRLQDPLAELVKIDPKSIGVGQYQHDVNQKRLKETLDNVIYSCVNAVGVELNTASAKLLSYVSGVGPALAKTIVNYRSKQGNFPNRNVLKQVPKLGEKTFEQCAGFLRIQDSNNPLDRSGIHPERYDLVARMAADVGADFDGLMKSENLRKQIDVTGYIDDEVGEPTLKDILSELESPGRDPREEFRTPRFNSEVTAPEHLKEGMELEGVVTNVTNFGAFVDIGVHQDGLVHVSELSDTFVSDPDSMISVGKIVKVKVLGFDKERKRISLTMRSGPKRGPRSSARDGQARRPMDGRRDRERGPARGGAKRPPRSRPRAPRHEDRPPANNPFAQFFKEKKDEIKLKKK